MDENIFNQLYLETPAEKGDLGIFVPSYLRNMNQLLQEQQTIQNLSWEIEGKALVNNTKFYYSRDEKKTLKYLVYKGVPDEIRVDLWMISSGAKREMQNNPKDYYDCLLNKLEWEFEWPCDKQIELDINRTFPDDPYFHDEKILQQLRNVLRAYSRRNHSIGYVQGFNFIVGRLLKIVKDEEKVFWLFTQIIEDILPINYYSEMAGLLIDVDILIYLIRYYYEDLFIHMEDNILLDYFKNIILQWFLSLFIHSFPSKLSILIWDIMFIDKSVVLFKIVIGIIKQIKNDLLNITTLDKFKNYFNIDLFKRLEISDLKYYLILRKFSFNQSLINKNREVMIEKMKEHIQKFNQNKMKNLKNKLNQLKNNNFLFCDHDWPICMYDLDNKYNVIDTLVLRTTNISQIIEKYKGYKQCFNQELNQSTILIERMTHTCNAVKSKDHNIELNKARCSVLISNLQDLEDESCDTSIDDIVITPKKIKPKKTHYKSMSSITYEDLLTLKKKEKTRDFDNFVTRINSRYNKLINKNSLNQKTIISNLIEVDNRDLVSEN